MCKIFAPQQVTIEEIISQNSAGMSDDQKAEYEYELSMTVFALLGKVDVDILSLSDTDWWNCVTPQYPSLVAFQFADSQFYTVSLADLQAILSKDWTRKIPYVADHFDCDKFANELYSHLCRYYGINCTVPVWGDTTQGPHGFNITVVRDNGVWIARLIEPQTDAVFVTEGPLGTYTSRFVKAELGMVKLSTGGKTQW
jgi:hypothetical protein